MSDAIVMQRVRKTFGKKVAVEGIDLIVPQGSLYGFIGPNGAGKTTTIRMIMSILFPDSGELSVLGHASALDSKDRIGYLPEERGLYKKMKVASFLEHMGKLKGLRGGPELRSNVRRWLDRIELGDVAKKKCEELSKGMQQKVQFITCVLHEPDLLILDEPFSGLDPVNMRLLRDLINEQHQAGKTVIFSTHVMQQAEQLCDNIVMIHEGRKVLDDSLDEIRRRHDPRSIVFVPFEQGADMTPIAGLPGITNVHETAGLYHASLANEAEPTEVLRLIVNAMPMSKVEVHKPTLEDIFIEIVQGSRGNQEDANRLRETLRTEHAVEEAHAAEASS